ncbi:hypothetical protein HY572_03405 [Candidatus Micrarchaeota archaeon]|nr:hypothetical protein [Candidatus Micrarchaeota archaeon]
MREKLLVLAKATPEISQKYEHLICVAGITDKGEWRRVYPIPWSIFWGSSPLNFKKKMWIEYELESEKPSDHRPESRKIKPATIKPLGEASFNEIEALLFPRITSIEELEAETPKNASIGVVKPTILDFAPTTNQHYEALVTKSAQTTLTGQKAIQLDIPKYKYRYIFKDDQDGRVHECLCEDWEVGELYSNCEDYRKAGKYRDENEVHQKVREKMLKKVTENGPVYFIMGSHYRFNTYMIVGVVYPRKADTRR